MRVQSDEKVRKLKLLSENKYNVNENKNKNNVSKHNWKIEIKLTKIRGLLEVTGRDGISSVDPGPITVMIPDSVSSGSGNGTGWSERER